ncbi:spore gernimation protein [Sporosarcina sp. P12(2017)]|uniref:PepSY1/2 domain-containing protein n=1 Tax=unclassified Sporosarcina TaxID=2647733 RepID=UPI000C16C527|nr:MULTISPECIES: PepSY1/2 domain-containing protein [unclassified Sporosarcina]PIC56777.1 spore gernimation protein [Sporosarcina sp. P10]PIC59994.1 spore gernimation protein [Sporosarcina sp. P12(2017)]
MKQMIFILTYAFIVLGIYTFGTVRENEDLSIALNGQYSKSMTDASQKLGELEEAVNKSLLFEDQKSSAKEREDIWRLSSDIKSSISSLPVDESFSTSWMNYLGRLGNFAKESTEQGDPDEYYGVMKRASENLNELTSEWQLATKNMFSRRMSMSNWEKKLRDSPDGQANWSKMGESVMEYTEAVFPLTASESDAEKKKELRNIKEKKITEDEAIQKFKKLLPSVSNDIIAAEKSRKGAPYPFYHIRFAENSSIGYLDLTEKGGHVLSYLVERRMGKPTVSYEELEKMADEFLQKADYKDLVLEEARENDNAWHFVYVRVSPENDAKVFSDPIHIKLAKDNGEVIGLNASEYIRKEQPKPQPIRTAEWHTFFRPDVTVMAQELAYVENSQKEQRLAHYLTIVSGEENLETYKILVDTETLEVITTEKQ